MILIFSMYNIATLNPTPRDRFGSGSEEKKMAEKGLIQNEKAAVIEEKVVEEEVAE